jgi:putative ABC transport system substrate-binding protein
LRRLGYVEGENVKFERYSGKGQPPPFTELVNAVVRSNPDLLFATTSNLIRAFKAATSTIPIVCVVSDPVAFGIVGNLAHPGGNITGGISDAGLEVWGKRIAFLRDAVPSMSRIADLFRFGQGSNQGSLAIQEAAQQMGLTFIPMTTNNAISDAEYRRFFSLMQQEKVDGIIVDDGGENMTHRRLIVELANVTKIPAIYPYREFVEIGGLMAYAVDLSSVFRQAAVQIDKILKGARPGDIPFYQATSFELLINVRTAKTLGIEIPPSLLARADEVIE